MFYRAIFFVKIEKKIVEIAFQEKSFTNPYPVFDNKINL